MLSNIKQPTIVRRKRDAERRQQKTIDHNVLCPECGVAMLVREGSTGSFYGCQRFPLCIGTRPIGTYSKNKRYDSLTQLLLDAHSLAVKYLAKPEVLGKQGCVTWWLSRNVDVTNVDSLEAHVDAASAKASELGEPVDFISMAYETRKERRLSYTKNMTNGGKYLTTLKRLKSLPKPAFTKRWDSSNIDQIEIDLTSDEDT